MIRKAVVAGLAALALCTSIAVTTSPAQLTAGRSWTNVTN